ncbi:MAG: hypothetical protein AAGI52_15635 [Bacteroidota bacterium]
MTLGAERTRVLVTVKAYPLPSRSYGELVCTAGFLEDGSWIRIYPVPFRIIRDDKYVAKYQWIEVDLRRNAKDFRPESYRPVNDDLSDIEIGSKIGTGKDRSWAVRRELCCTNVYTSKSRLLEDAYATPCVSLATFKPTRILDLTVEEVEREWSDRWKAKLAQLDMFAPASFSGEKRRTIIPKLPYKFSYRFEDEDGIESTLMIEDWEIGALYWNCLRGAEGDEEEAITKVREKYLDYLGGRDIHLFLGTTRIWHARKALNPFVIVGVFYPPHDDQLGLF